MRRILLMLACVAGLLAGSLTGAAAVLASGTNTSAGDNQYVDPLTSTTSASHPSSSSSASSSSSSSSGAPSSSGTSSLSSSPSTSAGAGSSTGSGATGSSAHAGTLPFTGMNIWACAAIGAGLLGAGVVLRRAVHIS